MCIRDRNCFGGALKSFAVSILAGLKSVGFPFGDPNNLPKNPWPDGLLPSTFPLLKGLPIPKLLPTGFAFISPNLGLSA